MTWFKSHIMRQNSPLLLINPNGLSESEEDSVRLSLSTSCSPIVKHNNNNSSSRSMKKTEVRYILTSSATPTVADDVSANTFQETTTQPLRLPHLVKADCQRRRRKRSEVKSATLTSSQRELFSPQLARLANLQATTQTNFRSKVKSDLRQQSTEQANQMKRNRRKSMIIMSAFIKFNNFGKMPMFCSLVLSCLAAYLLIGASSGLIIEAASSQQYYEVQPESQYMVQNGHDVRIRCLIRNRQGECLWLRNGRAIGTIAKKYQFTRQPEDGDCSLLIRNVSVQQDDGIWQCQVTASDVDQDTLQSREVHLTVLVPPERPQIKNMSTNTQRLILEENKTKFVVCEIRGGNPAPQIEWLLDNKNISKEAQSSSFLGQPQSGSSQQQQRITQSRLKVSDIKRTMNGKNLTCLGVHPTLNQSTSVELDVQYVPTVSVVQREYSIVEGSPLSISCQVDANPPPNVVSWRLVNDGSVASNGAVLEFERISRVKNQNVFECSAQNAYGISLPADVKLNVLYAPFLLNTSHSESVSVGSQAQLACLFDGNPEPEVNWHYTDPLSRSASAVQLENNKQQYLNIKNVTYRNEGDYHCEARNSINGVNYGVRSSNIILDVYGEPQFLVKSPVNAKAVQGSKSDLSLSFCADPAPNKVYWQFGSLRLDVRLNNINNGQQPVPSLQALSGGSKQNAMIQRFQVHPLQPLQKRESSFSKVPTCFEAQLSILEPELSDQRDYTLIVQNERGHQSASVRLRITSPLSPVLMISSAFVTICGLFLCSLMVMFVFKKRQLASSSAANQNGAIRSQNGATGNGTAAATIAANGKQNSSIEHLVNSSQVGINGLEANGNHHHHQQQQQQQQQTRGIVNGSGNGAQNGASNPSGNVEGLEPKLSHMMASMASSDTSGDQKQLLGSSNSPSNGSSSGSTTTARQLMHSADYNMGSIVNSPHSIDNHSTANSSPTPMNHISVDDEIPSSLTTTTMLGNNTNSSNNNNVLSLANGSTYQAAESPTRDAQLSPRSVQHFNENGAIIYANLDYSNHHHSQHHRHANGSPEVANNSAIARQQRRQQLEQHMHAGASPTSMEQASLQGLTSVGAKIAIMNSLAAAASQPAGSPSAGVLNGAINRQLAASGRLIRKQGPPKPPKPSIQQRSRFYQQANGGANGNGSGLVMIGSPAYLSAAQGDPDEQSANELAVEYSQIAFPARAEL